MASSLLLLLLSRFSRVRLCGTPWTAAHQAPLSMGFSRREYWSGVPLPSPMVSLDCNNLLPSLALPFQPEHKLLKNEELVPCDLSHPQSVS